MKKSTSRTYSYYYNTCRTKGSDAADRSSVCLLNLPLNLGYTISKKGILKGKRKVDAIAILDIPAPTNVSFLGSIQSYGKFIKDLSTLTEPLYCLLKKAVPWR